ncbi:MAG TPA: type II secretion system protein [Verrucomicrobiae bacterium]|nr:type II secretion system protein [Verrucomicrobiae bacterium]
MNEMLAFMKEKHKYSGFTLIELLVVLAVIGILAAVVSVNVWRGRQNSRDARRVSDIKQVQNALSLYADECGGYPLVGVDLDISGLGLDDTCGGWVSSPTGSKIYIYAVPPAMQPAEPGCLDPNPPNSNTYFYLGTDTTYSINFCLGSKVGDFVPGPHVADQDGIL